MNLINNLLNHQNNNNFNIIKELIEIIQDDNLKTVNDIKNFEQNLFTFNHKILTKQEKINYALSIIKTSEDYEMMTFLEIQTYKKYKTKINDTGNLDEKIKYLIKLYNLAQREMIFPYEAYNFIIENKLSPCTFLKYVVQFNTS